MRCDQNVNNDLYSTDTVYILDQCVGCCAGRGGYLVVIYWVGDQTCYQSYENITMNRMVSFRSYIEFAIYDNS